MVRLILLGVICILCEAWPPGLFSQHDFFGSYGSMSLNVGDVSYFIQVDERLSFNDAESFCNDHASSPMHLLSIKDENEWVSAAFGLQN